MKFVARLKNLHSACEFVCPSSRHSSEFDVYIHFVHPLERERERDTFLHSTCVVVEKSSFHLSLVRSDRERDPVQPQASRRWPRTSQTG